ncbi:MAG TPA: hypothetical protein VF960_04425, partial [Chloroflexota bacterium]
ELLKWPDVKSITLVDLDSEVVRLFASQPELSKLNGGSLSDRRVHVVNVDAFKFLEENAGSYGVIVADLPDPRNESLQKLYSEQFYRLAARRLAPGGVFVTQSTSPYFAPKAFWSIYESMRLVWPGVVPYQVNVPAFGIWGFIMASAAPLNVAELSFPVHTRFLDAATMKSLVVFPLDMQRVQVEPNEIMQPVILGYYRDGWSRAH